ncbi:MAG: hypothetical protein HKN82_20335 [Akkermansiaceae bacterium]|nr:hypothetical protein [Akkermansiaceae bacterium]NNM28173.1 hypothetical protein [Akkermansiaceae bacterium]
MARWSRDYWLWGCVLVVVGLGLNACAPVGSYAPPSTGMAGEAAAGRSASARKAAGRAMADSTLRAPVPSPERPGLGTGWGDERNSPTNYTSFRRASSRPAGGVATIYYNDREGIDAMTGRKSTARGMQSAAGGLVEWGVKTGFSHATNYDSGGRRFVAGRKGQRYTLVVRNLAKSRLEVVLSVDGLDVLDGRAASTRKRGYIIAPGQTLEVEGWRTSTDTVAAFEFSSVSGSYANLRHGDTRNVGVIGLAVFTEKGVDPWTWTRREVDRRYGASPFAEPPGGLAR